MQRTPGAAWAGQQVVPQNSWCACSAPLGQRRFVLLTETSCTRHTAPLAQCVPPLCLWLSVPLLPSTLYNGSLAIMNINELLTAHMNDKCTSSQLAGQPQHGPNVTATDRTQRFYGTSNNTKAGAGNRKTRWSGAAQGAAVRQLATSSI